MAEESRFDVFLSYSSRDATVVDELAVRLKADGLAVWFDKWEIEPGDRIGKRIEEGLAQSRVFVLAMSKNAFASAWVGLERYAALFGDPTNLKQRFVPVRLDNAEVPLLLAPFKAVDWTQSSEKEYQRLLAACRSPREAAGRPFLRPGAFLFLNLPDYRQRREDVRAEFTRICDELVGATGAAAGSGEYLLVECRGGGLLLFREKSPIETRSEVVVGSLLDGLSLVDQARRRELRMGLLLHWGDDLHRVSIGGTASYWSESLDQALRFTALIEHDHCLVSDRAFLAFKDILPKLAGAEARLPLRELLDLANVARRTPRAPRRTSRFPRHSMFALQQMTLCNRDYEAFEVRNVALYAGDGDDDALLCGNPERPPDWVRVEGRDKRPLTHPQHRFVAALAEANDVTIVALTHEHTRDFLEEALRRRQKRFWRRLNIVFPSEAALRQFKEADRSELNRRAVWANARRDILIYLQHATAQFHKQWDCLEYDKLPPFWGNRLVSDHGSLIRFAPLFPGPDQKTAYCFTPSNQMKIFEQLNGAFDAILADSKSLVEWCLFGELLPNDRRFLYGGIASRPNLDTFAKETFRRRQRGIHLPIVLIMVFLRTRRGTKICLQHRNLFNAIEAVGKFSNITGRLSTDDALNETQIRAFDREIFALLRQGSLDLASAGASTLATAAFDRVTEWRPGETEIADDVWRHAAAREMREELGLEDLDPARFAPKGEELVRFSEDRSGWFRLFSLVITEAEYDRVQTEKPHAEFAAISLNELETLHARGHLNKLLQQRFEPVFLPIYRQMDAV